MADAVGVVINLADARARRSIRRSLVAAAASGDREALRERRLRAAAFAFACDGGLDRHARLAAYDEACAVDTDERDPETVARIVLGIDDPLRPQPGDLVAVFGVERPTAAEAGRFVVETGGDVYCRLHGLPCDG